ncbi:glycosyltransferase family 4 protein [Pseudoalteromonas sp. SWYJZ12]|uniref:glycosyltransferase family 4 protein n=1 Tax=Pseudoalteromonas sp. SWYJZ12 TaxID=2792067 RepID=UPI0018CCB70C|nr:glycosyltransferase family 4 protein [Pseudoalteromonas sp. SWYJZ12]MBH0002714.1 glycosyltransferase family 4 protein [Pseudoalteromonas sp. SWYJZ12]
MRKLLIVTTVAETLDTILTKQPNHLNNYFNVYLATSPGTGVERVESQEGISVNIIPMIRGINPFYDLYSIYKMIRLLRQIKPDIIHSYTPKAGLVSMLASWLCRVPVRIHSFTGLIFPTSSGFKKRLLVTIDRLICRCATVIIPEGNGVKNDLLRYNITKKKLDIIGYGNIAGVDSSYFNRNQCTDSKDFLKLKDSLNLSPQDFVFCFVGRLNKDKGLNELVEAFSLLDENARLLVLGNMDKTAPLSKVVYKKLVEHPRIHLLGFQKDIRPSLALSNILVLPSYREGFPNVLLQAGAMSLPAIATDINGCNEIIKPNLNGWLVEPRNSLLLFSEMEKAMLSDKLDSMGIEARTNIIDKYERYEHWERMVSFYNKSNL